MVLCSIEEAWGSNFNNLDNQPKKTRTDNRYRYDYSRDSRPLSEHNGCYRNPSKHQITINNSQHDSRNNHQMSRSVPPSHSLEDNNDDNEHFENNYSNLSIDESFQPVEEDNDYESFVTSDRTDNNVFIEDEDNDNEDNFEGEEGNEISVKNSEDNNEYYNNHNSDDEDNDSGVTVNMSLIIDKLNKLIGGFEDITKIGNSGMKDISIFIIIGIFLIFIMDLIFRIGQKLTK